eukprot:CAMPEP_0206298086 /NCGR_PEP_ID=MMETSP0106_2-20121207/6510_1 /ASSEMBLY_ACC=CAM_ASM_000206 /TAXON_ID=81532 /ORGANISM="Acanthoeca-like sp., Strain 10tr" /LENGTH=73 /DNA_ID=CAMNT_0053728779 /DNA_START=82 /DNA_END=303 /DNA_ORIENTATION=+
MSQHPNAPQAYRTAVGVLPLSEARSTEMEDAEACSNGSMVHPESKPTHAVSSGVRDVFCVGPLGPSPPDHVGQ